MLIGKDVLVGAVRCGENAYNVIERATGKVKTRQKEGRVSGGGCRAGVLSGVLKKFFKTQATKKGPPFGEPF
jgi:hypothetical protein